MPPTFPPCNIKFESMFSGSCHPGLCYHPPILYAIFKFSEKHVFLGHVIQACAASHLSSMQYSSQVKSMFFGSCHLGLGCLPPFLHAIFKSSEKHVFLGHVIQACATSHLSFMQYSSQVKSMFSGSCHPGLRCLLYPKRFFVIFVVIKIESMPVASAVDGFPCGDGNICWGVGCS